MFPAAGYGNKVKRSSLWHFLLVLIFYLLFVLILLTMVAGALRFMTKPEFLPLAVRIVGTPVFVLSFFLFVSVTSCSLLHQIHPFRCLMKGMRLVFSKWKENLVLVLFFSIVLFLFGSVYVLLYELFNYAFSLFSIAWGWMFLLSLTRFFSLLLFVLLLLLTAISYVLFLRWLKEK